MRSVDHVPFDLLGRQQMPITCVYPKMGWQAELSIRVDVSSAEFINRFETNAIQTEVVVI